MTLKDIINDLQSGNLKTCYEQIPLITDFAMKALESDAETKLTNLVEILQDLITIGNITYNNTNRDILPIEDGVYDLLVNKLQKLDYDKFSCGATPIQFDEAKADNEVIDLISPYKIMSEEARSKENNMLYPEILSRRKVLETRDLLYRPYDFVWDIDNDSSVSKRVRNVEHNYPNLVGTLEKCKFVTNKQATDLGVFNDANVKVLERDFFEPLFRKGIINVQDRIDMIMTLKYDGVSIEADVSNMVLSARTRGDTDNNVAADLTPILGGYKFPNAPYLEKPIGMKFEAIITYDCLYELNRLRGTNYINGRTAIIGLLGASDAYKYRDLITLVPLQMDVSNLGIEQPSRLEEIKFLNLYYTTREYLRYSVLSDSWTNLLFEIKKFVEEAEFSRDYIRFMYDGVVLEFANDDIRSLLGRKNSINQYAMAIKFNALKKQTIFRGFTYSVGQDGVVTPLLHYDPVEFMGAIHVKSSANSLARFNELDLNIGDIIQVEYVNDVIPYATKIDNDSNRQNHMRPKSQAEKFPTHCPYCGTELVFSVAIAKCPNLNCPERVLQRMTNMIDKLGIKDFSEASMQILGVSHLYELMQSPVEKFAELGPTNMHKLYDSLQNLLLNKLPDFRVVGALGFSGCASKTWKLIFNKISIEQFYDMYKTDISGLSSLLIGIDGIGKTTVDTILSEMEYFLDDIEYIISANMYISSKGAGEAKHVIRFTGFRDQLLADSLNMIDGVDCDSNGSVTKKTTILLVPYENYTEGSKYKKAMKYGVQVVPVTEFLENTSKYIPDLIE